MSGKNLTFKLIMDGDSKGLVTAAKQSESVTKKVFETIKTNADQLKQTSAATAIALGSIVPEKSKELADGLTKSLSGATQIIRDAGDNAKSAASNFTDFGNKSVKALAFLKSDLEKAKSRLEAFSKTKATPADIEIAQKQVDQLEKEVQQAESAFIDFHTEVGKANSSLNSTETTAQTAQKGLNGAKLAVNALVGAMAALGLGLGVKELAAAADSYAMLSAKIQQSTKDSGNFEQAIAGVHQIALQTNSTLDNTGALFTRLNTVAKDMGKSQQFALDMTSTVTKAIQLGGSSTQEAEAAVQQFIQAMQGGVLRGEEFNSIMEGGYGLAEALAKGLGVTTGELRKMAEAGELSAERVLAALEKQKQGVDAQYAEMPLTISNALQKIATSWQILIGEMDQANGASATVAQWLSTLADNMGLLKPIIDDIGNGFTKFGAYLSDIYDQGAIDSLKIALGSIYETIKTLFNTVLDVGRAFNDVFDDALSGVFSFTDGLRPAGVEVSGLQKVFDSLNIAINLIGDGFRAVGVVTNLFTGTLYRLAAVWYEVKATFTWGDVKEEAIANMTAMQNKSDEYFTKGFDGIKNYESQTIKSIENMGKTQDQKNIERIANNEKTLSDLKAQEAQHVTDYKAISDERIKLHQQLVDARKAGDQLAIDAALAGLAELDSKEKAYQAESKKITDEKIKAAQDWVNAQLVAADGTQKVADAATQKTMQTTLAAQGLKLEFDSAGKVIVKTMTDAVISTEAQVNATDKARKAATALGIDLDIALGRVSEKFAADQVHLDNYANGFDELGLKGEQATNALYAGWEKWVAGAKSQVELDAAKAKLLSFGEQGKLSTSQVEMGMQAVKRAVQEIPDSLSPVEAAFERLGIKTKEQLKLAADLALNDFNTILKSGEATQDGLQQAYEETIRLAYASGDAQVIAAANAKAAYLGLEVQLDATGKATVTKLGEIQQAAVATQRTVSQVSQATSNEQPEISPEQQATNDHWDDFKAKMKARTDELNAKSQSRGSGGANASLLSSSGDSAQQISAVPDAPLIATSFDIQGIENMQPTEKKVLELQSGGKAAELQGTPEAVDSVEEMLREFEMLKRSM